MISVIQAIRYGTLGVLALLLAAVASFSSGNVALAAPGDNLASFDAVVTAGISTCSVGTGLAYDTTTDSLILSCWYNNVLERVDAVTHLNDGAVTISGLPNGNAIMAMAYDAGRNRVWACNNHSTVVLIDIGAAAVDVSQPALSLVSCTDGLAYDGSDDTLWISPDVSSTVYHYDLAGNPLGSFVPAIGNCGNSGIAVGGPKLYLANNGCSEIYQTNKDGTGSVLFASLAPFRLEDLECDNETFASIGKGAIWSQDAYDRVLNAWEIPADQCVAGGGGEPEIAISLDPKTDKNPLGTKHTVTAAVTADGDPAVGMVVSFSVSSGPNTGEISNPGECSANLDCSTDASGNVSWTYVGDGGLGQDVIVACVTDESKAEHCVRVTKDWVDVTPPVASCVPTVNPAGKNEPTAPGKGNQGQNQDGFYEVSAKDNVDPKPTIHVVDRGPDDIFPSADDYEFPGPFANPTKVKYTEANGAVPSQKPGSGVITYHLKGKGDMVVYAVDASGNVSKPVVCKVPPAPK